MMKAIRITKENRNQITEQYNLDEGFLELSSGLYLIAAFGHQMYEGLLTKAEFEKRFTKTGKTLENGYIEVALITNGVFLEPEVR